MITTSKYVRLICVGLSGLASSTGCFRSEATLEDLDRSLTVAVAPALNHSGSKDFDPIRMADIMVSELTFIPGVRVIPLNRTLAQLEAGGRTRIESPAHALQIMDRLGADGIVVFAITEYEPYNPPSLGISAQLFGYGPGPRGGFDPVASSRQSAPFEAGTYPQLPRAEYQRVFLGSNHKVVAEVKRFARVRDANGSAHGWRKFLASQEHYWRFCLHKTASDLIKQEVAHVEALRKRKKEETER